MSNDPARAVRDQQIVEQWGRKRMAGMWGLTLRLVLCFALPMSVLLVLMPYITGEQPVGTPEEVRNRTVMAIVGLFVLSFLAGPVTWYLAERSYRNARTRLGLAPEDEPRGKG